MLLLPNPYKTPLPITLLSFKGTDNSQKHEKFVLHGTMGCQHEPDPNG